MNKSVFPFSFWSLQCFQFNFFLLQFTTYKYGRMCRQIYVWHRSRINKESTTQYVYFFFGLFFAIISTFSSLASSNLLHIRTTFAYSHSSVVRFVSPNYSRSRLSCRVLVSFVSGIRQIFHSEFAFRKFVLCRLGWFVLLYAKCFFA